MNESTQAMPDSPDLADLFQQALDLHRAGNLYEAGSLYQTILKDKPDHAEANHKLGLIAVQAEQPEAGLSYFEAALNTDPTCKAYWLSYIDALLRTSQYDEARNVMALARQSGLEGEEANALDRRIAESLAEIDSGFNVPDTQAGKQVQDQDIQLLLDLFNQRRYNELEQQARALTRRVPQDAIGWKMLGIAQQIQGDNRAAIAPMQKAIERNPTDVENHYNLGVVFQELGQLDNAAICYRQALALNPGYADAALNLGVACELLNKQEDAEHNLKLAIALRPDSTKAISNLGIVLQKHGRHTEAEACFRKVLDIQPGDADAHAKLAISLREQDRLNEAEANLRNALHIRPDDAELHNKLAIVLQGQGCLDEADVHFQIALGITPEKSEFWGNLGNLQRHMGRLEQAVLAYREALKRSPDDTVALVGLGDVYRQLSSYDEAEHCYREALSIDPDNLNISLAWGITVTRQGHLDQGEACFRNLLDKYPSNPSILSDLGQVLQLLGRLEEAAEYFRQASLLAPNQALFYTNWLYCLLHSEAADMESVFKAHFRFGERFEAPLANRQHTHPPGSDPDRKLRIGFVSADFWNHAVFHFIEPILDPLRKYEMLDLHAYYNNYINDTGTQRLKTLFDHWTDVANLSDSKLAEQIHSDSIDILIDLSGHTAGNRLLCFAFKPAPVQASWIGYPGTTGLRSIDYYLADRYMLPPGRFDHQFTEKIVRLPAIAPFQLSPDAPEVNALPALTNGHFTFGSFNRPNKLSERVIALWSQLLGAVPDSVMLLGGMVEEAGRKHILDWFNKAGVSADRLRFHPRAGMREYLQLHHQVDLCLDTFPYNGGTTTNHALWMGVPTLTLAGANMAGRCGAANLSHAGLEAFIVESPDEFVERGLYWVTHLSQLAEVREGLRERLLNSPLRNPELLAASLAQALRQMWTRHCTGLPPESFEIQLSSQNTISGERLHGL